MVSSIKKNNLLKWFGVLPANWKIKKLKFIASEINDKRKPIDGDIKISPENVESVTGKIFQYYSDYENDGKIFKPGDILFNKLRVYLNKVILCDFNGLSMGEMIVIRSKKVLNSFLYRCLSSSLFIDHVNSLSEGIKVPRPSIEGIFNMYIPIPSITEQKLISQYLDKKIKQIDFLIKKKESKIKLLKEQKTALINQSVTKGLNPNAEMKNSGIEWIGEIPKHWKMSRIKFHGDVLIGLSFNKEDILEDDQGTLVLRSSNVQDGRVSFKDSIWVKTEVPEKLRIKNGDILICSRNGSRELIGKNCLLGKESEGMTWGVFMTVLRTSSPNLFYWILNSQLFKSQSGIYLTSTINQLTVSTLENMIFPFTSDLNEQNKINVFLKKETEKIDHILRIEDKIIKLIKEYRQSLISSVVTGKIRVTEDMI